MNRKRGKVSAGTVHLLWHKPVVWLLVFLQLLTGWAWIGVPSASAATVYVWNKYEVTQKREYRVDEYGWAYSVGNTDSYVENGSWTVTGYPSFTIDEQGKATVTGTLNDYSSSAYPNGRGYYYYNPDGSGGIIRTIMQKDYRFDGSGRNSFNEARASFTYHMVDARGSSLGDVTGYSRSDYPTSGVQDGFWYEFVRANSSPTLTVYSMDKTVNKKTGNTVLTLSGTLYDPDGDLITVSASVNGVSRVLTTSASTWQLQWTINELASGSVTNIPITYTDGLTGVQTATYTGTITVDKRDLVYYDKYTTKEKQVYTGIYQGDQKAQYSWFSTWYTGVSVTDSGVVKLSGNSYSSADIVYRPDIWQAQPLYSVRSGWAGYYQFKGNYFGPDDTIDTGFYYPYQTSSGVKERNNLVQSNIYEFDGTYPVNGEHSDGFWYVRKVNTNAYPVLDIHSEDSFVGISTPNQQLTITGSVSDADGDPVTVSATINGVTKTRTVVNGSFTLSWPRAELAEGDYTGVLVTADDGKGGTHTVVYNGRMLVDLTAPLAPSLTLDPSNWVSDTLKATITPGYDAYPGKTYVSVNGSSFVEYTTPITRTAEGSYTFEVYTEDATGNRSETISSSGGVAKTPPTAPVLTVSNQDWSSDPVTFSVSGSTSVSPLTYEYKVDGGEYVTGSTGSVSDSGEHVVTVRARDAVGQYSPEVQQTVRIDKTLPNVTFTPESRSWGSTGVSIQVGVTDTQSGVRPGTEYAVTASTDEPTAWEVLPVDGVVTVNAEGQWYLHVRASDNAGNTGVQVSDVYQIQSLPAVPTGVTAVSTSTDQVRVTWELPSVLVTSGYEWEVTNKPTGNILTASYPQNEVVDTGLQAGMVYDYDVVVRNHVGSETTSVSALTYPAVPSGIRASALSRSGESMEILWDAVESATGYHLVVTEQGGSVVYDEPVNAGSAVVTGLQAGTRYTASVSAVNNRGEGDSGTTGFLTLPAEPGNFVAAVIGVSWADLEWSVVDTASEYALYRDTEVRDTVTGVTYRDDVLTGGTRYEYQVAAINETGEGELSSVLSVFTLPEKDSSLAVTGVSETSLTATWSGVLGADRYEVSVAGHSFNETQESSGTPLTFTGLTPGTVYTVTLTPINETGRGESTTLMTTTVPDVMVGTSVGTVEDSSAEFSFTDVGGADRYKFVVDGKEYVTSVSPFVLTDLKGSTNYTVAVSAGNAQGFGSPENVTFLTKPSAPSGVVVTGAGESTLALEWSEDPTATGYEVELNGFVDSVTGTSYTANGLDAGIEYNLKVRTINATGTGSWSSVVGMTQPSAPVVDSVSAEWTTASVSWGSVVGATRYEITSADDTAMYYSGSDPSVVLEGLEDGVEYSLRVYAVNKVGQRSEPEDMTFVTKVGTILGLVVADVVEGKVTISLPDTTKHIDRYDIYRDGVVVGTVLPSDGSWSDTGVLPNTNYKYDIIPVNTSGEGTSSSIELKTPTIAVDQDTVKVTPGDDSVTIEFEGVPGGSEYVLIEDGVEVWRGDKSPIILEGLTPGASHDYTLVVDNGSGYVSSPVTIPVLLIPAKPSGIVAVADATSVRFDFTGASDNTVTYLVYVDGKEVGRSVAGQASLVVAPLKSSTDYVFEVYAENGSGVSKQAQTIEVKTKQAPVFGGDSSGSNGVPNDSIHVTPPVKEDEVPAEDSSDDHSGTPPGVVSDRFIDTTTSFARNEINALAEAGILKGVSATNFEPTRKVTRIEFASMLVRAKKEPASVFTLPYQDINSSAWYVEELKSAVSSGIAQGVSATKFEPNKWINREQATKMMVNAKFGTFTQSDPYSLLLTDISAVSGWAYPSVGKAVTEGLVVGFPDGTFRPKSDMTRAEAAMLIYRMLAS